VEDGVLPSRARRIGGWLEDRAVCGRFFQEDGESVFLRWPGGCGVSLDGSAVGCDLEEFTT